MMPIFRIKLSDKITLARAASFDVNVPDSTTAMDVAHATIESGLYPDCGCMPWLKGEPLDYDETQTDSTPWRIWIERLPDAPA